LYKERKDCLKFREEKNSLYKITAKKLGLPTAELKAIPSQRIERLPRLEVYSVGYAYTESNQPSDINQMAEDTSNRSTRTENQQIETPVFDFSALVC
jgi:hypothetical protein